MPTFPYNSQNKINANPVAPIRNEAGQAFQDEQKVIGTLQEITQKWSDANDVMQYTEAKAKHGLAVADIESRAAADPNYKDSDKYFKELNDAKTDILSGIKNQQVASKARAEFNYNSDIAALKIKDNFQRKSLIDNRLNVQTSLNTNYQKMATATDNERIIINEDINSSLERQVSAGTLSHAEAIQYAQKAQFSGAVEGIFSNPDRTINDLKNKEGIYSGLNPVQRMNLISKAENYKKRLEREKTELQKEAVFNNESNIVLNIAQSGQAPSAAEMANMVKAGSMDADFAESTLKAITNPDAVSARTDGEEFSKLTLEIMKSTNKDQLMETVKKILKGGGDGKLSKPDMQILVQSAIAQGNQKRNDITKAVISLGDYADQSNLPRADLFREFQKNISEGKDLNVSSDEAKKKVILNTIKGASNLDDVPNVIVGKDNKTRYIFNKNTNIAAHRIYQPDKAR